VKTLVAFYSPSGARRPASGELRSFLRDRLPDYMLPATFLGLDEIPVTANGKANREALRAIALQTIESSLPEAMGESHSLEAALTGLWRQILGQTEIAPTDSFFDLGGTSLTAAALADAIERKFKTRLPLSVFFDSPTVARMVELIVDSGRIPSWSPLVPIQANGTRPPIFCVHAIRGNVLSYRALPARLGPDQPVYGLQARGLNGRDLPHGSIEAMAAEYLSFIRQVAPHGPSVLIGYSAGGVVAFEMARQLALAGYPPPLLLLIDTCIELTAEQRARGGGAAYRFRAVRTGLAKLRKFSKMDKRERISAIRANLDILTRELRIRFWVLRGKFGIPAKPLSVEDAFALAVHGYVPEPLECEVVLLRPEQSRVDHADDPTMGWGSLISGRLTLHWVGGDHFTMLRDPFVAEVASRIEALIGGAAASGAGMAANAGRIAN
jgi:thioesterase domain-containing protein/acyl carrier protein